VIHGNICLVGFESIGTGVPHERTVADLRVRIRMEVDGLAVIAEGAIAQGRLSSRRIRREVQSAVAIEAYVVFESTSGKRRVAVSSDGI